MGSLQLKKLELQLSMEERQEKAEYNKINEEEKAKRIKWMTAYHALHPNKFV